MIFDNPSIENQAFSYPEGSKNDSKIDAKMGTLKRMPKNSENVLKVTPTGDPLGTVFPLKRVPEK